jgi:hypothetical protein
LWESQAEIRTLRQFSRKQRFIVPTQTQRTHVQRLSPKNKGVSPYIPCKQVAEQKARSNPCIIIYNFIGYFTLVLHDFPLPVLHDLLHVQIPQVLSFCNAIPTSLLLYQNSGLVCFLLVLLPLLQLWSVKSTQTMN